MHLVPDDIRVPTLLRACHQMYVRTGHGTHSKVDRRTTTARPVPYEGFLQSVILVWPSVSLLCLACHVSRHLLCFSRE
ncbi:hypothetical protein TRIATDRAFT_301164 [Trichoderma atroviride IMI 206040]|uniref:Uncharacterized protein n=1 Tax=Hypocrea atroviridis (strain ATCC 20476 / IMI 206040) TaxID=452589 RepID=G9P131_HYPAI|nr:uncharacterized protein TRIATDRAFT_301164 [Trichoderma atroviride IMI 206040]EHK43273.1 hypothetical protein TRIATDRAFT_301164 [Trichoderma atroviride IMI 206040]